MKRIKLLMLMMVISGVVSAAICCGEDKCIPTCPRNEIEMVQCVESNATNDVSSKEVQAHCRAATINHK